MRDQERHDQGSRNWEGQGKRLPPPNFFDRSTDPILIGGGQIMPTKLLLILPQILSDQLTISQSGEGGRLCPVSHHITTHPQIFKPCTEGEGLPVNFFQN